MSESLKEGTKFTLRMKILQNRSIDLDELVEDE